MLEFLSMLSKQVEHNKCPFLIQNVFVDLSISFLQIRHLNIGGINNWTIYALMINDFKKLINLILAIQNIFTF